MSDQRHDDVVTIVVVRTGGFAGLRRQWRVDAGPDEAQPWLLLIDECSWDGAGDALEANDEPTRTNPPARSGDRFLWSIRARTPDQHLEQDLPEPALTGAWRVLVDAVRAAGQTNPPPGADQPG